MQLMDARHCGLEHQNKQVRELDTPAMNMRRCRFESNPASDRIKDIWINDKQNRYVRKQERHFGVTSTQSSNVQELVDAKLCHLDDRDKHYIE